MTRPGWWRASRARVVAALLFVSVLASSAAAQSADNLLLVINTSSPDSIQVGDYYARKRMVAADRILRLTVDPVEQVGRVAYERQIEAPIARWFSERALHDRILYIVLTKGVPLRIDGTPGLDGTGASVDSELTLLYRRMAGQAIPPQGFVPNPYFLGDRAGKEAARFTHETQDIFLVTRLDGYTVGDVTAMIDRGLMPARSGRFALDEKASFVAAPGNRWLERSADLLRTMGMGDRVVLDTTGQVLSNQRDLLGYYSWGSNDPAIRERDLKLSFVPGALAGSFVSTDGRTFKEPPSAWTYGAWEDPKTFFGGSPQSLAGDLVRQGVTGVSGHVAEPYLDATIRPDVLFPAYVSGFNLAESFYLAMPYLGWQTVIIGDPLVAPFRQQALGAADIDKGIDPATDLPAFFSARITQTLSLTIRNRDAARLFVRGQVRLAKNDVEAARDALEQATKIDARLISAHLLLAGIYERTGANDDAIERYRRVLKMDPSNVAALNNLAYVLARFKLGALEEATQLARRANSLAPRSPNILDTLAWILHLAGDDRGASAPAAEAARLAPDDPLILLHSATILAATGGVDLAAKLLARAVELDPAMEKQADVQELRSRLSAPRKP